MPKTNLKNRKYFSNAIDNNIYKMLQDYHKSSNIPISKILDIAIKEYIEKKSHE